MDWPKVQISTLGKIGMEQLQSEELQDTTAEKFRG